MVGLLLVSIILLFFISLISSKNDFISPTVTFSASFLFSVFWLFFFASEWGIELHSDTTFIVLGGMITFLLVCNFTALFLPRKKLYRYSELSVIKIDTYKKIIFLAIVIAGMVVNVYIRVKFISGSIVDIWASLTEYRTLSTFTTEELAVFPKWSGYAYQLSYAGGYWFGYVIINNYLIEKKIDKLSLGIVVFCIISSLTMGSRGGMIDYLLAFFVYYIILRRRSSVYISKKANYKLISKVIAIFIVFLLTFRITGNMIGRENSQTMMDYLSTYCGAEIANFDYFIHRGKRTNFIWGSQTFYGFVKWIGKYFGLSSTQLNYKLDSPFRFSNGYNLGNVNTTFYAFYYDFGVKGVIILTSIMAAFSQISYVKALKNRIKKMPSLWIVLFGFIYPTLLLSFFSNKFYEKICNKSFIYAILFWILLNVVMTNKITIRKKKVNRIKGNAYGI